MPLTEKGKEIKSAMERRYGAEKGEQVFYASKNKGTISGVDRLDAIMEDCDIYDAMHNRMDSWDSLVAKLMKEGKSKEYSEKIAGKVYQEQQGK